jgi:DNA-binding response OmpR family regulator
VAQLLLVEDDVAIRTSLIRALTERGHAVTSAPTAMAGLQAAVEPGVELVLLDLGLPDLDGIEVAGRLKAWPGGGPAVVLTSSRDASDYPPRFDDCGARGFIAKAELSGDALAMLAA